MIQLTPTASSHEKMITFSFAGQEYQTKRIIGEIENGDGPTFVFTGGIHGNEPTGVIAIQQVISELAEANIELQGRVIGLAGNMRALESSSRFHSKDLNRIWNEDFLKLWEQQASGLPVDLPNAETEEQLELFAHIEPILADQQFSRNENDPPKLFFADLHTTSSKSIPFIGINDQIDNRRFALKIPAPIILGIEEYLEGPLLSMLNDQGHVAMAFEAGQHDDPLSLENHKSFIYLALLNAGIIPPRYAASLNEHKIRLHQASHGNQGILEVVYRKQVAPEDQFVMKPGFKNFSNIKKGQELATDRDGHIAAHRGGKIFMPLYQSTGNDGFFIVRSVPSWALGLSRFLRRINFEKILVLLPGVSRSKVQSDALVVNKRVAKFLAVELFHLLGYRRKRDDGEEMIFSRREIKK
jgi:succinylglutamate desuccinylase